MENVILKTDAYPLLASPLWAGNFSGEVSSTECHASARLFVRHQGWSESAQISYERRRRIPYYQARGNIRFAAGSEVSYYANGSMVVLGGAPVETRTEITFGWSYRYFHCGKISISIPNIAPIILSIPFVRTNQTRANIPAFGVTIPLSFTGSLPSDAEVGTATGLFFKGDVSKLAGRFDSRFQEEMFISACIWAWLQNQAASLGHAF